MTNKNQNHSTRGKPFLAADAGFFVLCATWARITWDDQSVPTDRVTRHVNTVHVRVGFVSLGGPRCWSFINKRMICAVAIYRSIAFSRGQISQQGRALSRNETRGGRQVVENVESRCHVHRNS